MRGDLWVKLNYVVIAALIQTMKSTLVLMEQALDQAAIETGTGESDIHKRADGPNGTEG